MRRSPSAESPPPRAIHWSLYFLLWTVGVIVVGTALGGILFPLVGKLIGARFSVAKLAANGARMLGFYAMIWAPGLALVLTVKRAYEQRQARK